MKYGTKIELIREAWLKIRLDTAPVDQGKVLRILERLYAVAKKPVPKHIIYLDSPLQIAMEIAHLRLESEDVSKHLSKRIMDEVAGELHSGLTVNERLFLQDPLITDYLSRERIQDHCKRVNAKLPKNQTVPATLASPQTSFAEVSIQDQEFLSGFACDIYAWPGTRFYDVNTDEHTGLLHYVRITELISEQINETCKNIFRDSMLWELSAEFGQVAAEELVNVGYTSCEYGWVEPFMVPNCDLARNCGWAVLFWDWAFISEKPELIHCDEQTRLHCETGAALRYPDRFSVYAIHGIRVPEKVVVSPELITISEIESEQNVEVRRVMIDRYGLERFLIDSQAVEIHRDEFGVLYRKEITGDEALVMLKVINSTPEPDGSFKDYFLRVPPQMECAQQAVAWTFGKTEDEYSPALQT